MDCKAFICTFLLILLFEIINCQENVDRVAETNTHMKKRTKSSINKNVTFEAPQSTQFSFLNYILNNTTTSLPPAPTNETTEEQIKYVTCIKDLGGNTTEIIDRAELLKLLLPYGNNTTPDKPGRCICLLFFAPTCPFSAQAAPHFNALPRGFPDIKMVAIDASLYHSFNTQYGVIGIPTLVLFHQGRPVSKFNSTEYTIEQFAKFLTKYTKIEPVEKFYVTSADFSGPIPSTPERKTDYVLILAWAFILVCFLYHFSKSVWFKSILEMIKSNWRESEAQHEHNE